MNFVIDVRPLIYPGTGNYTYLFFILKDFLKITKNNHWNYIFISHKKISDESFQMLKSYGEVYIDKTLLSRLGPLWLHFRVPQILQEKKAHIFWSTLFIQPFALKKRMNVFSVLNIHDLNAWVVPQTMIIWNRWYLKLFTRNSIQNSDLILCLSQTTKDLIFKYFPAFIKKQGKFKVVYPGIIKIMEKEKKPENLQNGIKQFLFSLGTLEPRKNFDNLIKAYILAKEEKNDLLPLVIAGKPGWQMTQLLKNLSNNLLKEKGVYFVPSPDSRELKWLYKNCRYFVFPSLYEGFGLPILECSIYKKIQLISQIPIFLEIGRYVDNIYFFSDVKNINSLKIDILQLSEKKYVKKKKIKPIPFSYQLSAKLILKYIQEFYLLARN